MQPNYSKPFLVMIMQDCREVEDESNLLNGQYGVCLGLYNYPNTLEKTKTGDLGNPLILTQSGNYIWGRECWWAPVPADHNEAPQNLVQKITTAHKEALRKKFGIEIEAVDPEKN